MLVARGSVFESAARILLCTTALESRDRSGDHEGYSSSYPADEHGLNGTAQRGRSREAPFHISKDGKGKQGDRHGRNERR